MSSSSIVTADHGPIDHDDLPVFVDQEEPHQQQQQKLQQQSLQRGDMGSSSSSSSTRGRPRFFSRQATAGAALSGGTSSISVHQYRRHDRDSGSTRHAKNSTSGRPPLFSRTASRDSINGRPHLFSRQATLEAISLASSQEPREEEEKQAQRHRDRLAVRVASSVTKFLGLVLGFGMVVIYFFFLLTMGLSQIIVGAYHYDPTVTGEGDCPKAPMLASYLIVNGIFMLLFMALAEHRRQWRQVDELGRLQRRQVLEGLPTTERKRAAMLRGAALQPLGAPLMLLNNARKKQQQQQQQRENENIMSMRASGMLLMTPTTTTVSPNAASSTAAAATAQISLDEVAAALNRHQSQQQSDTTTSAKQQRASTSSASASAAAAAAAAADAAINSTSSGATTTTTTTTTTSRMQSGMHPDIVTGSGPASSPGSGSDNYFSFDNNTLNTSISTTTATTTNTTAGFEYYDLGGSPRAVVRYQQEHKWIHRLHTSAALFLIIWWCYGAYLVFEECQDCALSNAFCDHELYWFSFWSQLMPFLILAVLLAGVMLMCLCTIYTLHSEPSSYGSSSSSSSSSGEVVSSSDTSGSAAVATTAMARFSPTPASRSIERNMSVSLV